MFGVLSRATRAPKKSGASIYSHQAHNRPFNVHLKFQVGCAGGFLVES